MDADLNTQKNLAEAIKFINILFNENWLIVHTKYTLEHGLVAKYWHKDISIIR